MEFTGACLLFIKAMGGGLEIITSFTDKIFSMPLTALNKGCHILPSKNGEITEMGCSK
jgi:hypothetical protein